MPRSDDVSPLSNCRLCVGACEKIPRKFAHRVFFFNLFFLPLSCLSVYSLSFVSLERHQSATDFNPGGVCGGPLFSPPLTSARVQSRFEFVKLGTYICALIPQESLGLQAGTKHYIRKHSMYVPSIYGMYRYQRFTCSTRRDV